MGFQVCTALLQADVNVKMVARLRNNVKKSVKLEDAAGHNTRRLIERAVFRELCGMLDGGEPFRPKKNRPNVVMFVGLQGNGKTTTCTKFAYHYKRKGWKSALVCADTYRAGAFDQLRQNATKAGIPFFGSYTDSDPVNIAVEGVERFKKAGHDMILVDTSGRHKQEEALFEEMRALHEAVQPDDTVFVLDGSVGQAAFDQAAAFRKAVGGGSGIVTKLDGHAKGGGALSAVAATQSPVTFLGTGEHIDEFEAFDCKGFVSRLLGLGDWKGFMTKIEEVLPKDDDELIEKLQEGKFSMRLLYEQYANIQKMGPVGQVMSMIPGFNSDFLGKGAEKEGQLKIQRFMTIMDSMTQAELDATDVKMLLEPSRLTRLTRGSGRHPQEVALLVEEYKRMAQVWGRMKNLKLPKGGNMSALNRNMNLQQMSKMLPPQVLNQMGGMGALQGLLKQMENG